MKYFKGSEEIEAFLGFKYIPKPRMSINENVLSSAKHETIEGSKSELIEKGQEALSKTFEEILSLHDDSTKYIVPLSGGLDSRTILGGLLETVDRSQIVALTFGVPGTLDFEIGKEVAKRTGIENHQINLSPRKFGWTEELFLSFASKYKRPFKLPRGRDALTHAIKKLGLEDHVLFSGYLGDVVAGGHLPENESENWATALGYFLKHNFESENVDEDFNPLNFLPEKPCLDPEKISYDEQLDLGIRQPYFIKHGHLFENKVEMPFTNKNWLKFILNIPRKYRSNEYLLKKIIQKQYPKLSSIRTEKMRGLKLRSPYLLKSTLASMHKISYKISSLVGRASSHPMTNHFDWNVEIRNSPSFCSLVKKGLEDLARRGAVKTLDPVRTLEKHLQGKDCGKKIQVLFSLEIFLKMQDKGRN